MAGIKERLIQFILRGKDELSPEAKKSAAALEGMKAKAEELGQALDNAKSARGLVTTLEATRRAVEQSAAALEQGEQNIEGLRRALDASPDSEGLKTSLVEAERQATRMRQSLSKLRRTLGDHEQAAQAAGVNTEHLADEHQRLEAEVEQATAAVNEHGAAVRELERSQAAAARSSAEHASRIQSVREGMSGGAKQVLAFAAAYVSLDAAFSLVGRGIGMLRDGIGQMLSTGDKFEGLQQRMTALMGSVAGGEQATAWIKDFATRTPLELEQVTEAFAQLKAYGVDPMDGTLQSLVDQNEKLGGGMERLQGIVSAVGQAFAKQKLQTEEILQLVERGVPAWDMLAKVTGKNSSELEELASKGKLGRDVIRALVAEIGKSSNGAAEAGMSRLSGIISNLKDQATDFYNRIADAGALDFVKGKLKELSDTISQMAQDGRLDKLAKALSDAFIQGSEKLEGFAKRLLDVDFNTVADDSSRWLSDFGTKIDDAAQRVQLFVAPFRTMFNGLTSGFAVVGIGIAQFVDQALLKFEVLAKAVPSAFGGDKLRASIADARGMLNGLSEGLVAQIEQDGRDIEAAWDTSNQRRVESSRKAAAEQTSIAKSAADQQRMLDQAAADHLVANQQRVKDAAIEAATSGTQAISSMANALQLIDTADSVEQLEGLQRALLKSFQSGTISQEEFAQASGVLNGKLKDLKSGAAATGGALSDLEGEFDSMESILGAVGRAMNEVDFNKLRAGIRKAYSEGKISAQEFAKAQKAVTERIAEVAPAVQKSTRALQDQRREIGETMEETRRAVSDVGDAAEEAGGGIDFFGQTLTTARTPLANMSKEALAAFDALQGVKNTDIELDLSSVEKTAEALEKARNEAAFLHTELMLAGSRGTGLGIWMVETLERSQKVQAAFLEQKLSLQQLMRGYETGELTLADFVERAKSAQRGMDLLDKSDLDTLTGAIAAAEQQMKAMGDSTRNTLEGLQDELDRLQGNEEDIERRRFSARRRELEAQQAEAQKTGDQTAIGNIGKALSMLRQLESETAQQREAQAQQKRIDAANKAAESAPSPAPAKPSTTIRLESARGAAVDVQVPEGQQTVLLDILQQSGLRAL